MLLSSFGEAVNAKSLEKEVNKNLYEFFIQAHDWSKASYTDGYNVDVCYLHTV
jgi:hypothetical protein